MKKLPVILQSPIRVVIMVGLILLVGEFLITVLFESLHAIVPNNPLLGNIFFKYLYPIALILIASPVLYFLVYQPLNRQAELAQQLDELRRFQKLTIGRELRMKELMEEIATLRNPLSAYPAGEIQATSGSQEESSHAAEQNVPDQLTEEDRRNALLFMLEDLEDLRKKIEHANSEWTVALDVVDDPIFLHDKNFQILRCNRAYQQCADIPYTQIIGQPYYEIFPKTNAPLASCLMENAKAGAMANFETIVVGDTTFRSRAFSVYSEQGEYLHSAHIFEDITDTQRSKLALRESEAKFRTLYESSIDAIVIAPLNDNFIGANPAAIALFGCHDEQEFITLSPVDLSPEIQPDGRKSVDKAQEMEQLAMKNGSHSFEWMHKRKDGSEFLANVLMTRTEIGGRLVIQATIRDITQHKKMEEALFKKEHVLSESQRIAHIGGWEYDLTGQLFWSDETYHIYGVSPDIFTPNVESLLSLIHPDDRLVMQEWIAAGLADKNLGELEFRIIWPDGTVHFLSGRGELQRDAKNSPTCLAGTMQDITERKQAEILIKHANRSLATLSAVDKSLVHATNEDDLLQAVCKAIVEQRSYRMAWVGYVQHDENKSIKIMAHAGHDEGYLDTLRLTWADDGYGMGPSGRAVRSGTMQLSQNIASDPQFLPWRDAALKCGYAASIALPLANESDEVFGILHVYADEVNAFVPAEIDLLEEMANDIAFGVRSLNTRHERDIALEKSRQHLAQLQDSLEDTVRAIATIVEMRDPYTAGHQVRVADLAVAIAKLMGLPDDQIHAIYLGGIVHDVGKIIIPAEILSKPGRITDTEFSLIKVHPQAGYDILKGIHFPWPIAQIVLQHHERFDGSGYPQGLKGDDTLLEARILCVADVVEAMYSHRPYRPGLGIEVALAEITKQRGIYFDPAVVDACLTLFQEQHYTFKS